MLLVGRPFLIPPEMFPRYIFTRVCLPENLMHTLIAVVVVFRVVCFVSTGYVCTPVRVRVYHVRAIGLHV